MKWADIEICSVAAACTAAVGMAALLAAPPAP